MNQTKIGYQQYNFVEESLKKYECQQKQCCLHSFQFFNNFEVAPFSLWRDSKYINYFDFLDKAGGFFYERWGDAPVRSYYLITAIDIEQIFLLKNFFYGHYGHFNLPSDPDKRRKCQGIAFAGDGGSDALFCTGIWEKTRNDFLRDEKSKKIKTTV